MKKINIEEFERCVRNVGIFADCAEIGDMVRNECELGEVVGYVIGKYGPGYVVDNGREIICMSMDSVNAVYHKVDE